ncbi:MAG: hypothetical protein AAGA60_13885 [Cyanobacteria bacterium P01_E01_bin.42]
MVLARSQSLEKTYWAIAKSFLTWMFALTVCLLVVGFPLMILMATIAALAALILQSVLPASAVLVVAASTIGINVLAVVFGAAVLTLKGIHPEEVSWLNWLHGEAEEFVEPKFASCPLTCEIEN